jgi:hypothetical protein
MCSTIITTSSKYLAPIKYKVLLLLLLILTIDLQGGFFFVFFYIEEAEVQRNHEGSHKERTELQLEPRSVWFQTDANI